MAEIRKEPYSSFNYLLYLGTGGPESAQAGFSEVSGLGVEINVVEYRNWNKKYKALRKATSSSNVTDITLKRGLIDTLVLFEWLDQIRNGQNAALRTVTIRLLSDDRSSVAMEWKLTNVRPIKYTGPTLNGNSTETVVEELVLATERIDQL